MFGQIIKIVWKNKGQNSLLILEIFVSFIILAGVFAYLITNYKMLKSPLGFETKDRLMVLFGDYEKSDSLQYVKTIDNLKVAISNFPEIKSHSFGNSIYPFSWNNWSSVSDLNNVKISYSQAMYDDHFDKTMSVPVIDGKWVDKPLKDGDIEQAVVNERFVQKYFPDKNIIDSVMNLNGDKKIVGVVKNFKYNGEFTEEEPMIITYQTPYDKQEAICLYLQMQPNTPVIVEEKIGKMITEIKGSTNFVIKNLDEDRKRHSRATWVNVTVLSVLALFLIINVAMGLFGVLWYNINKRRYEISIRKAMGASASNIILQFILELLGLTIIALLLGSLIIWQIIHFELLTFLDKNMLYQGMFLAFGFIFVLVLICAFYPSWRAAKMHPALGLKED